MMYSVDYEKLSGEIDPAFFQQYLQENGWTPFKTKREDVSVFQYIQNDQFEQVDIPCDRALCDYSMELYQAVRVVANVEGKTVDQMLRTLLGLNREKTEIQCDSILEDIREQGRIDERVENISNLVKNMQWAIERAIDALGIALTEREICLEALKEQSA